MDQQPKRSLANVAGSAAIACAYIAVAVAVVQAATGSDDWQLSASVGLGIFWITFFTHFAVSTVKALVVRIGPSIRRRFRFTLSSMLVVVTLLCVLAAAYRAAPVLTARTAGFAIITLLPTLLRLGWHYLIDEV